MKKINFSNPLLVGILFLLLAVVGEIVAILVVNDGGFAYTLDDPYIHMALAENIGNSHYGVNSNEFSAPSSSILWPLIVAAWPSFEFFPLVINAVAAFCTIFLFHKVLKASLSVPACATHSRNAKVSVLLVIVTCATNVVGLIFTGMEHSLQLLLVTMVAYGLIVEAEHGRVTWWLLFAIVVAPLVRYENAAISCVAIAYLLMNRHYKVAVVASILVALPVGLFSAFLVHLDLGKFPTSILEKSSVVEGGGKIFQILGNIEYNLMGGRGKLLAGMAVIMMVYMLRGARNSRQRQLAGAAVLAIVLHLAAGRCGWYHRYEIYAWAFSLLLGIYFFGKSGSGERFLVAGSLVLVSCFPYVIGLFTIPLASNNIYSQQYQMHRFAVDFYDKPVAVNDLGFVSYKNDRYVLDLWGLASLDALKHRKNGDGAEWMDVMAKKNDVELAMIYRGWFKAIPQGWLKVGDLRYGGKLVTSGGSEVAFYAMNENARRTIVLKLCEFEKTLPRGATFVFSSPKAGDCQRDRL